jgi:S-adenosylmethionine:tRNA ribosyltransferase-isomerase
MARLDDFDYLLPESFIARHPLPDRGGARLLCVPPTGDFVDARIADLPSLLRAGDLLVVNDSRVIRARLWARKPTGGRVELLLVEPRDDRRWVALARGARKLSPGLELAVETRDGTEGPRVVVDAVGERGMVELTLAVSGLELARAHGELPLPPYLQRAAEAADADRYQTVFAAREGSVAAPTAGLHFTPELLARLEAAAIEVVRLTLHVGPGTFLPVTTERVDEHVMHEERFELSEATYRRIVDAKANGRRVVAVGTTSCRVLESFEPGQLRPGAGRTRLFIRPGHAFRWVDVLLTNFHLPRSTLLMLVAALAGRERILAAYERAKALGYRFYSYGDACLIERAS